MVCVIYTPGFAAVVLFVAFINFHFKAAEHQLMCRTQSGYAATKDNNF
jgi:hypothetical protein